MGIKYSNKAFFISPKGKIVPVWGSHHIDEIISDPGQFGLTRKAVEAKFDEYGEKLGVERKAREEIIADLLKKGWIRVRFRPSGYIIFQIDKLKPDVKKHIVKFLKSVKQKQILPEGVRNPGVQIFDISNPVEVFVYDESVMMAIKKLKAE